jgi:hypothetical protein
MLDALVYKDNAFKLMAQTNRYGDDVGNPAGMAD